MGTTIYIGLKIGANVIVHNGLNILITLIMMKSSINSIILKLKMIEFEDNFNQEPYLIFKKI